MNVLIVDDEPLARERLSRLVAASRAIVSSNLPPAMVKKPLR